MITRWLITRSWIITQAGAEGSRGEGKMREHPPQPGRLSHPVILQVEGAIEGSDAFYALASCGMAPFWAQSDFQWAASTTLEGRQASPKSNIRSGGG